MRSRRVLGQAMKGRACSLPMNDDDDDDDDDDDEDPGDSNDDDGHHHDEPAHPGRRSRRMPHPVHGAGDWSAVTSTYFTKDTAFHM